MKNNNLKNIEWKLFLQFLTILYGLLVPKLIIKTFGSDINGLISSVTQFLGYISILEGGFGGVIQFLLYKPLIEKKEEEINNILYSAGLFFKKIACIFIIYIIALCIIYPLFINNNFDHFFTISLIIVISISSFSEYYFGNIYKILLIADQKSYVISIIQSVTYFLNIILVLIVIKFFPNIIVIKLVTSLIFVLRPVIQCFYVRKKYNIGKKFNYTKIEIKSKWDAFAQHIAAIIRGGTDIAVLTIFSTLTEVSVYSIYYMVLSGVQKILISFSEGFESFFGMNLIKLSKNEVQQKFDLYEFIFLQIIVVVYSCLLLLLIPFVKIYMGNVSDAVYIRPLFAVLLCISEIVYMIRNPYSKMIIAAGHYKETSFGAWVEAILNIVVSIILVIKFGIIGVAIGTIVAMVVRTIEFVYHVNVFILNRPIFKSVKRILLVSAEILFSLVLLSIFKLNVNDYLSWFIYSFILFFIELFFVSLFNCVFEKENMKNIYLKLKGKKI